LKTTVLTQEDIAILYDTQFDRIYRFFYFRVISREIAEDLTSETFLTFVNLIKEEKEIENLRAFLYGVAKNIFMQYLKQKYKDGIPFSVINSDFEDLVAVNDEIQEEKTTPEEILLHFLDKIPNKQKEVIRLRFIEKLSLEEICKKLEKDMNYVKTTQKRGIKSLKKAIATNSEVNDEL
jgi:RNA polymerase sigma-70 factor (ECF subfamily)